MGQSILIWSLWTLTFLPSLFQNVSNQPPEVGVRSGSQVVAFSWLIGLSRMGKLQG